MTTGLTVETVLFREWDLIDDIRRISREVRDSFFSSGEEAISFLDVEEMDSRLSERGGGPEPAEAPDEVDMLRSALLVAGSTDKLCERGASDVSCSTVNGLA